MKKKWAKIENLHMIFVSKYGYLIKTLEVIISHQLETASTK